MNVRLFTRKGVASMLTLIMLLSIIIPMARSYAATPSLDQIRVALYIQARGSVPAVTLSAQDGLQVGLRTPSAVRTWASGVSAMRGAVDQYMLYIHESGDYQTASKLRNEATAYTPGVFIFKKMGPSGPLYQVAAGPFATKSDAEKTLETLSKQHQLQMQNTRIGGPLYWTAGSYPTREEAERQVTTIHAAGLDAVLSLHENADAKLVYSVWVGGSADQAGLDAVKAQAAQLLPALPLSPADTNQPYLLQRIDVTDGLQADMPFFSFNAADQKVWVESVNNQHITVKERYGRAYRGGFELSQYSGLLAVINELPFEAYLYSVVGSEMGSGWPLEALKAQAVAARSYALSIGVKYNIAHVSDTTYEQAYKGIDAESPAVIQAVDATRGEVLVNQSGIVEAMYYSNAGGMTADATEIWGRSVEYAASVPSPDQNAEEGLLLWNRVILPDGKIGFIRSDYTRETGKKTPAGLVILEGTSDGVNVRNAPYVDDTNNPAIAKLNQGDELILLEQRMQSNPFSWTYGPYSGSELLASIQRYSQETIQGPLKTLEVTKRGPSGRVTEVSANGVVVKVSTPDTYRSAFKGLPSTRFEIENTNRITVIDSSGSAKPVSYNPGGLHVLSGNAAQSASLNSDTLYTLNGDGKVGLITSEPSYRFIGNGFGHGVGLSQYGAKEMAEFLGYDYQRILKYYYQGVDIVKAGQ